MINHKYKVIFVHIPRTAGSSIGSVLGMLNEDKDHRTLRDFQPKTLNQALDLSFEYAKLNQMKNSFRTLKEILMKPEDHEFYADYKKVAFVRNPWSRTLEWYHNVMRNSMHRRNLGIKDEISFEKFLNKYKSNWALNSQLHWLVNFDNKIEFDFIGRFENIHSDFNSLCKRIGASDKQLPVRPKRIEDYTRFYNPKTKDKIFREKAL